VESFGPDSVLTDGSIRRLGVTSLTVTGGGAMGGEVAHGLCALPLVGLVGEENQNIFEGLNFVFSFLYSNSPNRA